MHDIKAIRDDKDGWVKALSRRPAFASEAAKIADEALAKDRELRDLLVALHRVPHVQARAQFQVARLEHAFQQQDRATPAQGAHTLGLAQVQQRKAIGATQAFVHALDAVAIGVGLDHGPDAGVGRGMAHACQVVAQGLGMDGGLDRTGHGNSGKAESAAILAPGGML